MVSKLALLFICKFINISAHFTPNDMLCIKIVLLEGILTFSYSKMKKRSYRSKIFFQKNEWFGFCSKFNPSLNLDQLYLLQHYL